jgi:hypothetical protein
MMSSEYSSTQTFDAAFALDSLQRRLRDHSNLFVEDVYGGARCRACSLPVVYRTLHLKILVNGTATGVTTTRSLPVCLMCHEWGDQFAQLCLTTEEAIARGLIQPPSTEGIEPATEESHGA